MGASTRIRRQSGGLWGGPRGRPTTWAQFAVPTWRARFVTGRRIRPAGARAAAVGEPAASNWARLGADPARQARAAAGSRRAPGQNRNEPGAKQGLPPDDSAASGAQGRGPGALWRHCVGGAKTPPMRYSGLDLALAGGHSFLGPTGRKILKVCPDASQSAHFRPARPNSQANEFE